MNDIHKGFGISINRNQTTFCTHILNIQLINIKIETQWKRDIVIIPTGYLDVIFIPRSNKKSRSRMGFIIASFLLPKEIFKLILYPFGFLSNALFVLKDLAQLKLKYSKKGNCS